jgi:hypothetical protein
MRNTENMTELEKRIAKIYSDGRREFFEDGMESEFSVALEKVIQEEGIKVLNILLTYLNDENVSFEVFSEGLVWIGYMDDDDELEIKYARRLFLEYCLLNSISARVKDSAGLGLAHIDDPASIPALQMAVNREVEPVSGPSLKVLLQQVLDQLLDTQKERGENA